MAFEPVKSYIGSNSNTKSKRTFILMIAIAAVLVIGMAVLIIMMVNTATKAGAENRETVAPEGPARAVAGVSLNGTDISGMTREEALAATSSVPDALLAGKTISVDVEGQLTVFTLKELGMETDYAEAFEKAFSYQGTDGESAQASETAAVNVMDFALGITAGRDKVKAALIPLKEKTDTLPADAGFEFSPWGFLMDGKPFKPDIDAMILACAKYKAFNWPERMQIPEAERPNKLRYQYWKNKKYIKDYIPADAYVSRFLYKDAVKGRTLDIDSLADSIVSRVQNGDFSTIPAPLEITEPAVKLEDLKYNTQLIASWTSSYSNHKGYERNWNVAKMSGIINGVTIKAGKEWSINKEAGPRRTSTGWKEAAGIDDGGYTDQAGGGVCQISSTLYNAAIRSALTITDFRHHSIISDYIPLGLDATISTGGPDLKIKNPNKTPVYIVSYMNPKEMNVTVEFYGPPVKDPKHGEVILNFSFKDKGSFGNPTMKKVYNTTKAPDGKAIATGKSYTYAKARKGRSVQTYKHTLSPEGKELKKEEFSSYTWRPRNGTTYVNGPDPKTIPPEPSAPISPEPSAPISPEPSAPISPSPPPVESPVSSPPASPEAPLEG